jgi:hypothetical protein
MEQKPEAPGSSATAPASSRIRVHPDAWPSPRSSGAGPSSKLEEWFAQPAAVSPQP